MATQKQLDAKLKKLGAKKKALEAKALAAHKTAAKVEKRERGVQKALEQKIKKLEYAQRKSAARSDDARKKAYTLYDKVDDIEGEISEVGNEVPEEFEKKDQNHVEGDA
jgi:hypothetical protein